MVKTKEQENKNALVNKQNNFFGLGPKTNTESKNGCNF